MAEVWRATVEGPHGFRKPAALKRSHPHLVTDKRFVTMFIDEARLAAHLQHANIVQMFDFDSVDGVYYIAMELVEGRDLWRILERSREQAMPLSLAHVCYVGGEILKALRYAHDLKVDGVHQSIVHRDISPQNVLVSYGGEVKLSDFGIAKAAARLTSTRSGTIKGKIAYMGPEQIMGSGIDHRADLFSLGATLYELATGRRPFKEDAIIRDSVVPLRERNAALGEDLERVVLRLLAPDPGQRYASAAEALIDLTACRDYSADSIGLGRYVRELFAETNPEGDRAATEVISSPSPKDVTPSPLPINEAPTEALPTRGGNGQAGSQGATRWRPVARQEARWTRRFFVASRRPAFWSRVVGAGMLLGVVVWWVGSWSWAPQQPPRVEPVSAARVAPADAPPDLRVPGAADPAPVTPEAAAAQTTLPKQPAGQGLLRVVVVPWAEVRIDGGKPHRTPLEKRLDPGTHTLRLDNAQLGRHEEIQVRVSARGAKTVERDWLVESR